MVQVLEEARSMKMSFTTVSIVIAAHEAEATIDQALKSVAAQTFTQWDCIVVDDHSSDRTKDIIQRWSDKDPRFKLLQTPSNLGPSSARNLAISMASGEWIAILDADDHFEPERLINLLTAAEKLGVRVLFDNQTHWTASSNTRKTWLDLDSLALRKHTLTRFLYQISGASRTHWGTAKPLFQRSLLKQRFIQYDVKFRRGEDVLFMAQLIQQAGSLGVCGAAGYVYRVPEDVQKNLSLADSDHAWRVSKTMREYLAEAVGWWGRLWLSLRVLHFALDDWRHRVARARRERRYFDVLMLILSEPRSWFWLSIRVTRRLRP